MKHPKQLETVINFFRKLPGVGYKTAERFAFHLLDWSREEVEAFSNSLASLQKEIKICSTCGALMDKEQCPFCTSKIRDTSKLCILSSARDIYQIEKTKSFNGIYHVLEELLSPLSGNNGEKINIEKILHRISAEQVKEIIIALDSTLEGDATALFIKKNLSHTKVQIYRLAFGLPVGSSLEYIDGNTLVRALSGKQVF